MHCIWYQKIYTIIWLWCITHSMRRKESTYLGSWPFSHPWACYGTFAVSIWEKANTKYRYSEYYFLYQIWCQLHCIQSSITCFASITLHDNSKNLLTPGIHVNMMVTLFFKVHDNYSIVITIRCIFVVRQVKRLDEVVVACWWWKTSLIWQRSRCGAWWYQRREGMCRLNRDYVCDLNLGQHWLR